MRISFFIGLICLTIVLFPLTSGISYQGTDLVDMTINNGNDCYMDNEGMYINFNPCTATEWKYNRLIHEVNISLTSDKTVYIMYDGVLKGGNIYLRKNGVHIGS